MDDQGPQVQVFHFTSRISSAKIKKYKLATERGMAGGNDRASPATNNARPTPSPSTDPATMEPPAKKPRLKLNVRPPTESQDTIAVSRPKRESSLRIRYSEDMVVDAADIEAGDPQLGRPSPAASSDLSSLSTVPSIEKEPPRPVAVPRKASKAAEYGRDFMSFYVTGDGDDDEEEEEEPEVELVPTPVPKKPDPPKQQAPAVRPPPNLPRIETQFKHHVPPQSYPTPKLQPPRAHPPQQQPSVQLHDNIPRSTGPKGPVTASVQIQKLKYLTTALTNFGGIPAPKKDDDEPIEPEPKPNGVPMPNTQATPAEKNDATDDLLALFDDEDSNEGDGDNDDEVVETTGPSAGSKSHLDRMLETPGQADSALTYGIRFIQNALQSWAHQRLTNQYAQYYWTEMKLRQENGTQRRGPGRPRKFDNDGVNPLPAPPPLVMHIDLAKTPEGAAIAAFQEVLDAGCLQVNAIVPIELSRALRHLYMQIDHLINQGARSEPKWQCMSYGAQIAANRARVEKWKQDHAKTLEEVSRRQQETQQKMMKDMGIAQQQHRGGSVSTEQAQHAHAIDLERRRSMQQAAQQPHLSQYLNNPLTLKGQARSQPRPTPKLTVPSPSSTMKAPTSASPAGQPNGSANVPNGVQFQPSQNDPKSGNHLDKIKLYMPNYLPRSGHSMKFSFAPTNELAVKAFGAQAFPTNHVGSNIPNRGPIPGSQSMSSQSQQSSSPVPVSAPAAPAAAPPRVERSHSDIIAAASRAAAANNAFIARGSASSPPKPSIELPNGTVKTGGASSPVTTTKNPSVDAEKATDANARLSQPGAIVVDQ